MTLFLDLFPYAASAVAILTALLLFAFLKGEIRRQQKRWSLEQFRWEEEHSAVQRSLADLRNEIDRAHEPRPQLLSPVVINLTRRAQVLRLFKRGSRPDQIAASLGIPRHEVDLILKLQRAASAAVPAQSLAP